jgi:hypothetical protein
MDWGKRSSAVCAAAIIVLTTAAMKPGEVDRAALKSVKQIVFLGPAEPKYYYATTAESRGQIAVTSMVMGGGLIPSLIAAGVVETPLERKLEGHLASLRLGAVLREEISQRLSRQGYDVSSRTVAKREPDKLIKRYVDVRFPGDAYLDMAIVGAGYNDLYTEMLCPSIYLKVRLIENGSLDELCENTYEYSCREEGTKAVQVLAVDLKYRFQDHNVVADNADLALEGIMAGVTLIADRVAAALDKSAQ